MTPDVYQLLDLESRYQHNHERAARALARIGQGLAPEAAAQTYRTHLKLMAGIGFELGVQDDELEAFERSLCIVRPRPKARELELTRKLARAAASIARGSNSACRTYQKHYQALARLKG